MIELTPEQRQAVQQGEPVRVVDPGTHDAYVVVRAEVYERLGGAMPDSADEPAAIPSGIFRSMQAFWRDLPELLKKRRHQGKWVAYHGEEQVGIAAHDVPLIRALVRKRIPDDAYYLAIIRPRALPPWEVEEIEPLAPQHLEDW